MSSEALSELEQLLALLKIEKEEDFEQHRRFVQSLPLVERVEKGYCWYPVAVVRTGYSVGDRAFVVVEKPDKIKEHQFRAGKTVSLFTQQAGAKRPEISGVIHFVDKNKMHIILNAEYVPEWTALGQVGVDLLFDERSYLEMERALRSVMNAKNDRLADLREVILGRQKARFSEINSALEIPSLNSSQCEAVREILAAQDIALIHGPPGTGKTTTLVQAVKLLCKTENTVLVTAPSNAAADLLTERIAAEGLSVVRIGNISRVDEDMLQHTLEVQLAKHPDSKHIKKVKVEANALRREAKRFRRKFGREEHDERKQLFQEAGELMAWANQMEERLLDQILDGADVITCTLVGAANKVLEKRKFRTVVIDEAAQALEPATWIPILKASKVVLTGDPFQLPPTVKSETARRQGFDVTMLEKCLQRLDRSSLLNVQYRMNAVIMGFSNLKFYNNALIAHASVAGRQLPIEANVPLVFLDTAGCGFEEQLHEAYQSRFNPEEFQILCEHLYQLIEAHGDHPLPEIAVISPYREQVNWMQQNVALDERLANIPLEINTIDAFQGQERDVVYLSLVRSNMKGEIGFLSDYRRMNVAMTRARLQLIVVGDSATIGGHAFYEDFLRYCENEGAYQTAWEFMR